MTLWTSSGGSGSIRRGCSTSCCAPCSWSCPFLSSTRCSSSTSPPTPASTRRRSPPRAWGSTRQCGRWGMQKKLNIFQHKVTFKGIFLPMGYQGPSQCSYYNFSSENVSIWYNLWRSLIINTTYLFFSWTTSRRTGDRLQVTQRLFRNYETQPRRRNAQSGFMTHPSL